VAVELDGDLEGEAGEANDGGEPSASAAADDSTHAADDTDVGGTPDDTPEGDEDSTS
jgi:hypothetical protein